MSIRRPQTTLSRAQGLNTPYQVSDHQSSSLQRQYFTPQTKPTNLFNSTQDEGSNDIDLDVVTPSTYISETPAKKVVQRLNMTSSIRRPTKRLLRHVDKMHDTNISHMKPDTDIIMSESKILTHSQKNMFESHNMTNPNQFSSIQMPLKSSIQRPRSTVKKVQDSRQNNKTFISSTSGGVSDINILGTGTSSKLTKFDNKHLIPAVQTSLNNMNNSEESFDNDSIPSLTSDVSYHSYQSQNSHFSCKSNLTAATTNTIYVKTNDLLRKTSKKIQDSASKVAHCGTTYPNFPNSHELDLVEKQVKEMKRLNAEIDFEVTQLKNERDFYCSILDSMKQTLERSIEQMNKRRRGSAEGVEVDASAWQGTECVMDQLKSVLEVDSI